MEVTDSKEYENREDVSAQLQDKRRMLKEFTEGAMGTVVLQGVQWPRQGRKPTWRPFFFLACADFFFGSPLAAIGVLPLCK